MTSYPPSTPDRGSDPYSGGDPYAGSDPYAGARGWMPPGDDAPGRPPFPPQPLHPPYPPHPPQPWQPGGPPQPGQYQYHPGGMPPGVGPQPPPLPENGKGTGSLVCSILSIVLCCLPIVGVTLGVVAIVLGVQGRRAADLGAANNRGVATAGLIVGSIGAAAGVLASFFSILGLVQG